MCAADNCCVQRGGGYLLRFILRPPFSCLSSLSLRSMGGVLSQTITFLCLGCGCLVCVALQLPCAVQQQTVPYTAAGDVCGVLPYTRPRGNDRLGDKKKQLDRVTETLNDTNSPINNGAGICMCCNETYLSRRRKYTAVCVLYACPKNGLCILVVVPRCTPAKLKI